MSVFGTPTVHNSTLKLFFLYFDCISFPRMQKKAMGIPSANISLNVSHYSHMALGSPSGQCHMAYIGTPAPLISPLTMHKLLCVFSPLLSNYVFSRFA